LHTQKPLMEELKKIQRVVARKVEGAPHEVWLVLDATNGQNAIQQARLFTAAVQVTGVILAKLDGTARAGALFRIQHELGLPVLFVGAGGGREACEVFEPESSVAAIRAGCRPRRSAALRERLLPWLVCLPALVLVLPFSPLGGDPYPHLAGAALALVLLV